MTSQLAYKEACARRLRSRQAKSSHQPTRPDHCYHFSVLSQPPGHAKSWPRLSSSDVQGSYSRDKLRCASARDGAQSQRSVVELPASSRACRPSEEMAGMSRNPRRSAVARTSRVSRPHLGSGSKGRGQRTSDGMKNPSYHGCEISFAGCLTHGRNEKETRARGKRAKGRKPLPTCNASGPTISPSQSWRYDGRVRWVPGPNLGTFASIIYLPRYFMSVSPWPTQLCATFCRQEMYRTPEVMSDFGLLQRTYLSKHHLGIYQCTPKPPITARRTSRKSHA